MASRTMNVSLLVPFTSSHDERARNWEWLRARYQHQQPDWQIVERPDPGPGEWSKGRALHAAAGAAHGDVFVVADADVMVGPGVLEAAVAAVTGGASWVVPFGTVYRLSPQRTLELLAGRLGDTPRHLQRRDLARRSYIGVPGGGIVVLGRDAFFDVGGIDPAFHGWGGEDESFADALATLVGPCEQFDNPLWHLWHPPQPRVKANDARRSLYTSAAGDPAAMRALVGRAG